MTILGGGLPVTSATFPTAQSVINLVSDDLLQRIAPEDPVMLSYINRVQLQLLRISRWQFLLSPVQTFVTQKDRSDYWIGTAGAGPLDVWDTGLNIANIGPIKTDTFFDRSNYRLLMRTKEQLLASQFAFRDASSRPGQPRTWRCDVSTPSIVNLYPAPDNQNLYQPQPEAPSCSSVVQPGNVLPGRIYFVRTTFVDSLGNESSVSDEARVFVPAGSGVVIQPPQEIPTAASGIQYNRWNVYIFNAGNNLTQTTGQETLANISGVLSNTLAYTEPITGFPTTGQSFPTANNVEALSGYLIQFRYYQAKPQVTTLSTQLVIPQDYLDVMVAGVNMFLARFLRQENGTNDDVQYWKSEYDKGVVAMIRDKNLFPKAPEYISPDPTSQSSSNWYGYESIDPWYSVTS